MFTRGKTIELASSGSFKAFKNKTEKKEKNENFFSEILNLLRISRNLYQYKNKINEYKYIIGLKKYFTGTFLPALDIDVQPSKLGMQAGTKFNFTDAM